MLWSQAFPFVALSFYESDSDNDMEHFITVFLICSFSLWVILNVVFFCVIDLNFVRTFVSLQTAPQYTCELFQESKRSAAKFRAAFKNRSSYTRANHGEIKEWVANNIETWRAEEPEFFDITKIPDEFLPTEDFEAEGGHARRRSSVGLREMIEFEEKLAHNPGILSSSISLSTASRNSSGGTRRIGTIKVKKNPGVIAVVG